MPVHEINGVGHTEVIESFAEGIDDLSVPCFYESPIVSNGSCPLLTQQLCHGSSVH